MPDRVENFKNSRFEHYRREPKVSVTRDKGEHTIAQTNLLALGQRGFSVTICSASRWFSPNPMKVILRFSLIFLVLHVLASRAEVTVTRIAAGTGGNQSLVLESDGSLAAMGY